MTQATTLSEQLHAQAAADEPLNFRQPPHNIDAEQALLGAILINNEAMDRVVGFLEAHHFYEPIHQKIYEVAGKLIGAGKQATPITLRTFFESDEPIDARSMTSRPAGR
jgi:replicative DNA helicase